MKPVEDFAGEADPVVLEFDHPGDKEFTIGSALPYRNWRSILSEIEKCDGSAATAIAAGNRGAQAPCGYF
jgi:hypothetical protein